MRDEIVIVSAVRTPIGRFGGSLKNLNSGDLGAIVIKESIKRAGLAPEQISEVILGEVRQTTESSNVARVAALRAGLPETTPAFTVNRLCASGMQAVTSGIQQIWSGQGDIIVAGGTENMSRAPIYLRNSRFGEGNPYLVDSHLENGQQPIEQYGVGLGMGMTAENVAEKYQISREDQDQFAYESQQKAAKAIREEIFQEEIIPVEVKERKQSFLFDKDEHPRPDTTIEKLAKLRPAFKENGVVTAGNACGRNDGAAALVMMRREKANSLGLKPLAKIVDWATAAVSPEIMGIGPVPAIERLLKRTNKIIQEIGLIELNEAFAAQALAVIREANLNPDKVNVNGGAIALGHPVGATGARIITTLLYEMRRRNERLGIATLCVGGGQGMAVMLEDLS
ncbi:thiolase family protein [Robertmurraya andreesenii]|uniref:acetyl-CoA C-acetyltransferase n=1 Tax=Anoxybacillus andreesenii TaxID=1325932 RepID=A0ABT9V150_9BACL|nr:thiolase family protein [Robertmurraya andreesenii]MDQ0154605.1 acetyl-CoA C-acetyltransferase [Robertmurraya andreesenii]